MSIELAERLKVKLTDKFVVVDGSVPELKRFAQWTGKVKTVNMSGRALVEFDGPADIGWYDIDPAFRTVVDGPRPKETKTQPKTAAKPAAAATPAAAKPAAAPSGGKSPLDMIRAQQAAKAGGAPVAAGGAKLSPMEMIRAQQAAKQAGGAAAPAPAAAPTPASPPVAVAVAAPVAETSAPAQPAALPTTGPDGKPLSKLDLIRRQGAAKR